MYCRSSLKYRISLFIILINFLFSLLISDNGLSRKNIVNKIESKSNNLKNVDNSKETKNNTWWRKFKRKMVQIKIWISNKFRALSGKNCNKTSK